MNDTARKPAPAAKARGSMSDDRRARARRVAAVLGLFTGVPTLLAIVYYGFMATPQYESVAVIAVESGAMQKAEDAAGKKLASEHDIHVVREHIRSRAMLGALEGFAEHYQGAGADFISALPAGAGSERLYDYYLDHVTVHVDSAATLRLHVDAFSPEAARDFASAILDRAGEGLDKASEASAAEVVEPAEKEVAAARQALAAARAAQPPDQLEIDVARERLIAAVRGLETARVEGARRARTMTIVAEPSLATEPSRPRRWWSIGTVFVTSLTLGGVLLLLGAVVREHARF